MSLIVKVIILVLALIGLAGCGTKNVGTVMEEPLHIVWVLYTHPVTHEQTWIRVYQRERIPEN